MTHRPTRRRLSVKKTLLSAAAVLVAGLALVFIGPAYADPSPAPGPAPSPPGAPASPSAPAPPGVPDPGVRPPGAGTSPAPSAPNSTPSLAPAPPPSTPPGDDPAWWDVPGQIRQAIVGFFGWAAEQAIQPVMAALGASWLSTPDFTNSPHVWAIWTTSLVTANGVVVLFVLAGMFVLAGRETVQTRYGFKEIAPRLVAGVVAANCSLIICAKAIEATNALTVAIAGNTVDGPTAAAAVEQIVNTALDGDVFLLAMLVLAVIVMCLVVEITWVLRLAALIVLVGIAPAALICHASPYTEGLARMWWRAFIAALGMQIGQAVIVMATVKVFLTPAGPTVMGLPATGGGLLGVLVCLTMLWLLIRLPGWMRQFVLGPLGGGQRGLIGQLVHTYASVKTFGAAAGILRGGTAAHAAAAGGRGTAARATLPRSSPIRTTPTRLGRAVPSRRAAAGPLWFSHGPSVQAPLAGRSGTSGPPAFSHPPSPPAPSRPPQDGVPPAVFSHPSPSPASPPARPAPASPIVFSASRDEEPTRPASGPVSPVRFSAAPQAPAGPTAGNVSRRPPTPGAPVFRSASVTAARGPATGGRVSRSRGQAGPSTGSARAVPGTRSSPSPPMPPSPSPVPPVQSGVVRRRPRRGGEQR
ncbi:hypothetical protein Val02_66390 [Virgisporangium aliadipatigenens]|uniref:Uncharacterized protein n=1 Tax=Virgisporangium aliadipatigenens TaxID=741659 RepID=A0A8J4DU66_9ACTN|nr:hypothetical protein [Virgisporangium aliadipatigenens]GIJ49753.1 hypothetical protein Val02_66390 [Virgisporangium aliadipatigenens]